MTICIATDNDLSVSGGITTFNTYLTRTLLLAGHKVVLLCVSEDGGNEDDQIIKNGNEMQVIFKASYKREKDKYKNYYRPGGLDAAKWIATGKVFAYWLEKNASDFNIDIIEASDYGGIGVFLCKQHMPPVVITAHCSLTQYFRYNHCLPDEQFFVIKELERLSFQFANAIITHSHVSTTDVRSFTHIPVHQTYIPWINGNITYPKLEAKGSPLAVGGLQILKGAEVLCQSVAKIGEDKSYVRWIGSDTITSPANGPMSEYLSRKYFSIWNKAFIWKEGLDRGKVLQEIAEAHFIIIPSLWDTFNYVALEAAAAGRAIIITNNTGAAELFEHNKNAVIIPPDNAGALAEAILDLQNNDEKRNQLGINAKALVDKLFTSEIFNKRIGIYINIINDFKGHSGEAALSLLFLKKYHTPRRKLYFNFRNFIKWILKKNG